MSKNYCSKKESLITVFTSCCNIRHIEALKKKKKNSLNVEPLGDTQSVGNETKESVDWMT